MELTSLRQQATGPASDLAESDAMEALLKADRPLRWAWAGCGLRCQGGPDSQGLSVAWTV